MIAVVDYGMGNLRSVQKGLEKAGYQAEITADPERILSARGVVLPGVGAFARAMEVLQQQGLADCLQQVAASGRPLLGICLGLQLLFEGSEESGWHTGLGLIPGVVKRLPAGVKVPHMGWNQVTWQKSSPLAAGIPDGSAFYFVHSYYVDPAREDDVLARTEYGLNFVSAVSRGNIFGLQFHPEKSSRLGLKILQNFGGTLEVGEPDKA